MQTNEKNEISDAYRQAKSVIDEMDTEGFRIIWKILNENIESLNTIMDCDSIEDLKARKKAYDALMQFKRDLLGIRESLQTNDSTTIPNISVKETIDNFDES